MSERECCVLCMRTKPWTCKLQKWLGEEDFSAFEWLEDVECSVACCVDTRKERDVNGGAPPWILSAFDSVVVVD